MEKFLKARKKYHCDHCLRLIYPGEIYRLGKGRDPRYKNDDINNDNIQVGIRYYQYRLCTRDDCDTYMDRRYA